MYIFIHDLHLDSRTRERIFIDIGGDRELTRSAVLGNRLVVVVP